MEADEPGSRWSTAFAGASLQAMSAYDAILARLFAPFAHDLVDRVTPASGDAALDVAAGPGTVAGILAERVGPTGRVVATDLSPAMLAIGREKPFAPGRAPIEWVEAPAAPLPLPDDAFDIATCQQGLQFFPDKAAALRELRRTLRDGGRAGVSVWTRIEDQVFSRLRDAIAEVVSPEVAGRYLGPFLLSGEEAADLARAAGFRNVTLTEVTLPAILSGTDELIGTLPASGIAAEIAGLDAGRSAALRAEVARRTDELVDGGRLRGSLTTSVVLLS